LQSEEGPLFTRSKTMHCKGRSRREQTEETRNSAFKIHKKRFPATLKLERQHERSQQRGNQQRRDKVDQKQTFTKATRRRNLIKYAQHQVQEANTSQKDKKTTQIQQQRQKEEEILTKVTSLISYRTRAGSIITSTIGNPQNGQKTEKKILQRTTEAHLKVQELLNRGKFFTAKRIPVALTYKPQTNRELKKRRRRRRRRRRRKKKR